MNSLLFVATGILPFSHSDRLSSLQTTNMTTTRTRDMSTKRGQWVGPVLKLRSHYGASSPVSVTHKSRRDPLTRLCHSNFSVVMPARWTKPNAGRLTVKSEIKSLEEFWILWEVAWQIWALARWDGMAKHCISFWYFIQKPAHWAGTQRYRVIFLSFVLSWALIRAVIEIKLALKLSSFNVFKIKQNSLFFSERSIWREAVILW